MTSGDTTWLDADAFARGERETSAGGPLALVVDLDDPLLAPWLALPPTARDLDDLTRPIAGPRAYFLKRRSLLRELVARWTVGPASEVVIAHDPHGAPRVLAPDGSIFVSVAARGSVAALALARAAVGIDLEMVEAPREPVWDVLHSEERVEVEREWSQGRDDRFRDIWVAKEAYLKALGAGLKRDPATVAILTSSGDAFAVAGSSALAGGRFATRTPGGRQARCALAWLR